MARRRSSQFQSCLLEGEGEGGRREEGKSKRKLGFGVNIYIYIYIYIYFFFFLIWQSGQFGLMLFDLAGKEKFGPIFSGQ